MTRIERLFLKLCPNGVEYIPLSEVAHVLNGYAFKSERYVEAGIRVIRISDVQKGVVSDKDMRFYPDDSIDEIKGFMLRENDLVMSLTGNVGRVAMLSKKDLPAGLNQRVACIRPKSGDRLLIRYIYHYFGQSSFERNALKNATGGGQKNMSTEWLCSQKIPLPPIEIQYEIVRILDGFVELIEKHIEELLARKKQYDYYRDEFLAFNDDVPIVPLGEIAIEMYRGAGIKREEITEIGSPCVRYGEIYTTYDVWFDTCVSYTKTGIKEFGHGDLLFAITGESVEEIAKSCVYMGHEKCFAGGDIVVMKHNQNPKYISYALSTTNARKQKSKGRVKSKVVHSSIPALKEIIIPLPPIDEQERVVGVLDRFNALVTDKLNGLPAEIAARQRQYEYYRDKLLSFK